VAGAWLATWVGGDIVLYVTAALIGYMAFDMAHLALSPERPEQQRTALAKRTTSLPWQSGLAAATGLYSGFLGLGGGFVIVPVLVRFFGFPAKRAVGTSLVAVALLAIPGSVTHYLLGNVDVGLALALTLGVVPGALLGAKVTAVARERTVRIGFAVMLLVVGSLLALNEAGVFA
jgi:uncharacterized membrane protein YfcA